MSGPPITVERHRGSASALHAREMPDDGIPRLWVLDTTGPAVVLGSTQDPGLVDAEAAARAGVEVVRRRSGGGAVWVAPDDPIWVDVLLPRGDPRWDDDVGRSFLPIGRAWQVALGVAGVIGTTVHEGAMIRTPGSDLVCFAGTGPGEVLAAGAKVVGISQRRTRAGARFQCALHRRWDPRPLLGLLVADVESDDLATAGHGVGDLDAEVLVAAFADALDAHLT